MKKIWSLYKYDIIFVMLFIGICLIYQYHQILFLRPQSIHQWRQTICTSIILNYYQHGMNFLKPEVHNLFSDGGTSGQSHAEFPIIYYFNAILWKIFGAHEFIPRLVNIFICLLGSFYLFKLLSRTLSTVWSIMVTLLLFTSPVIAFYANNFLVDIPILFICFISAYYFFRYYELGETKDIYLFMIFSLLCMLLKPSGGTFFLSVAGVFVFEKAKIISFKKRVFKNAFRDALLFIAVVVIVAGWYSYAFNFNSIHGGRYIQTFFPIWDLDADGINNILKKFFEFIFSQLFYTGTTFAFLFLFIVTMLLYKRIEKIYIILTLLLVFGSLAHAILWFQLWDVHDYYMFIFFLPIVFTLMSFGSFLKNHYTAIFFEKKTVFMFAFFLLMNVWYCSNNIRMRYGIKTTEIPYMATKGEIELYKWFVWNYGNTVKPFETMETYNRSLGISADDPVISLPDPSVCISLYLMNQRGWTDFGNQFYQKDEIAEKIKIGAKYLILNDTSHARNPFINPYTTNKIGQYKNVAVYALQPKK